MYLSCGRTIIFGFKKKCKSVIRKWYSLITGLFFLGLEIPKCSYCQLCIVMKINTILRDRCFNNCTHLLWACHFYLRFINHILMPQLNCSRLRFLSFVNWEGILGWWGEAMNIPSRWSPAKFCSRAGWLHFYLGRKRGQMGMAVWEEHYSQVTFAEYIYISINTLYTFARLEFF